MVGDKVGGVEVADKTLGQLDLAQGVVLVVLRMVRINSSERFRSIDVENNEGLVVDQLTV